jgi:cytidylate kinase
MPVVAITREMGSLGNEVADGLGNELGLPVIYHEVIDHLADRMRVRRSHVIRLLDGHAGLLERLTADKVSMFLHSSDEVIALAQQGKGAIIRGWGATHLLRNVPHVVCVRVCAPFKVRHQRMMQRVGSDDAEMIADEIHRNDEAHTAIMRRNFDLRWTDPEHYDVVLNTERVIVGECVDEILQLVQSPKFAETDQSRQRLDDLALAARVRAALLKSPETRPIRVAISANAGVVTLAGCSEDEVLALIEIVVGVPGVRDVVYRAKPPETTKTASH